MSQKTLIHIGYHKTASTWLQKNLLDNPDAMFKRFISKHEIRDHIVKPNSLYFDAKEVKQYYETLLENDSEMISVISSERLAGHPHSGGYDSKEIANRLHQVFPNSKVLIIIREQKSAIESCYSQYIKFGGPCSYKDYLEPPQRGSSTIPLFSFNHFNYLKLVKYYMELFGKNNVLVLPFELFKEDPKLFCSKIINFSEAQELESLPFNNIERKKMSHLSMGMIRQVNKFFAKNALNPIASAVDFRKQMIKFSALIDKATPSYIHSHFDNKLKNFIKEKVKDKYKESNKELSQIIGIDLAQYGYEV